MARIEATTIRDAVMCAVRNSDFFLEWKEKNPEAEVYVNEVPAELKTGSFFIKSLFPVRRHMFQNIYSQSEKLDIQYFLPMNENKGLLALLAANELMEILEYIQIEGDYFRGYEMEPNVSEGILHFYVTYRFRLEKEALGEQPMEELKSNITRRSD